MYSNVEERFVPDELPDLVFANEETDYVHNTRVLNAAHELLDRGLDEQDWGDRPAVVSLETDETLTYRELRSRVDRFAGALQALGVEPGDRVLWRFPEVPAAYVTQLATWKIGAITVPCIMQERSRELAYYLRDTEATVIVTSPEDLDEVEGALEEAPSVTEVVVDADTEDYHSFAELLETHEPIEGYEHTAPLDIASIYYTGGTTGVPKGCMHSHAEEIAHFDIESGQGRAIQPDDVVFCPVPVGHAFGNDERFSPLRFGASVVLKRRPSPVEIFDIIEAHEVTVFACIGTHLKLMMNRCTPSDYDLSSIRHFVCVGQAATPGTFARWHDLTGIEPVNGFGMTPIRGYFATAARGGERIAPRFSLGKPYHGYEIKLLDPDDPTRETGRNEPGRPAIRGPIGIAYWQNLHPDMPARQEEDVLNGWSFIDDMFRMDEDGFLWYLNRLDNMISSSGRQIAPGEVEDVLSQHELVESVAVIGKPHDERGEIVKAFVTTTGPVGEDFERDIQEYAKANMTPYKYPREIEILDEIPTDNVGKIRYGELAERVTAELAEERR